MTDDENVLDIKLDRSFDMLDADGDGKLEEQDLLVLAGRLGGAFDVDAKGPIERLQRAFAALWEADLKNMDTDGTETIDREEFRSGVRRAVDVDREGSSAA
ncbi:EF-hand domain-containing protein [Streptomyces sp. XD-27]|uniref:EF-hand domain-containing protein n=1 Tax=Streptomyces sp. XD-27 TaxID=3062779 RepID=UPI0026F45F84|nr:EF-hand domain-containing protein [Streptomyces sp. XD-27]WKX69087.1 EF-hand domain-containing protein [Streptomyces sp. XD-27]